VASTGDRPAHRTGDPQHGADDDYDQTDRLEDADVEQEAQQEKYNAEHNHCCLRFLRRHLSRSMTACYPPLRRLNRRTPHERQSRGNGHVTARSECLLRPSVVGPEYTVSAEDALAATETSGSIITRTFDGDVIDAGRTPIAAVRPDALAFACA
jgi:hypothetical protein